MASIYTQDEVEEMEKCPIMVRAPVREVVILCGVSGAGKTTYISEYLSDYFVCSADHYFVGVDGKYNFDGSKLADAHAFCLKNYIERLVFDGNGSVKIVVDNTNTTIAEVAPYAALALAYDCELEVVIFNTHWKEATERNKHGTPIDVVREQYNRLQKMKGELPGWWKVTYINEKKELKMVESTLCKLKNEKEEIEQRIEKLSKVDLSKYSSEVVVLFEGAEKSYGEWSLLTQEAENKLGTFKNGAGEVVVDSDEKEELVDMLWEKGEIYFL